MLLKRYLHSSFRVRLFVPIVTVLSLSTVGLVLGVVSSQKSMLLDTKKLVVASLDKTNKELLAQVDAIKKDVEDNLNSMEEKAGATLSQSTADALEKERAALSGEWETSVRKNVESLALLLSRVAPAAIVSHNFLDLIAYTKSATANPEVVYAVYLNPKGKPITRYLNRKDPIIKRYLKEGIGKNKIMKVLNASEKDNSVFIVERPVELEGKALGKIRLCVSRDLVTKKMEEISARFVAIANNNKQIIHDILGSQTAKVTDKIGGILSSLRSRSDNSLKTVRKNMTLSCNGMVNKMRQIIFGIGGASFLSVLFIIYLALTKISKGITQLSLNIREGAGQVSSAASQVSSASQSLAEAASEQATSIEQTASSLEEMSSMTKQNAENADQVNNLMKETNEVVTQTSQSMTELTTSMQKISKASEETQKIIKTIDEIAFQTNLLALNAAVEAARAGEAGAGFAVVADEVRNLAMRAADAAKDTSHLVEGIMKKVDEGSKVVTRTNETFTQVSEAASRVKGLIEEIAAASREQALGIEQVNKAVAEMDKVVQQTAANAEESAAAAEEMNAQSSEMKSGIDQLLVLIRGTREEKEVASKH
jgi:uncharacterized protein YukE